MKNFPNYIDIVKIIEDSASEIYKATEKNNKEDVLIKYLNKKKPTSEELLHFQYEYEILKDVEDEYIIEVKDFQTYKNSCYMVMQNPDSQSVEELLKTNSLSFKDKLNIAFKAANALNSLQKHNIIHKAISLSNMLYNKNKQIFKFINFSSSITLLFEQNLFKSPHTEESNLHYFSPEQTGRMNRNIDYRSDLYSLGVSMYRLFCEEYPFEIDDKLELYHAIIAKEAVRPSKLNSSIPDVISEIIMKLLQKNAEDRYQSASGIAYDIEKCINMLKSDNKIDTFELAQNDNVTQLNIPQKLFGRENEVNELMSAFERISKGTKEMLLVAGYSGVGKSALVNEVHKPITHKHGFFIEGKFDQLKRDTPYFTMIQAFNSLVEMILVEPQDDQENYKNVILSALGKNSQVLIELIPSFEKLLGKQESVQELSGMEAQNRFNYIFSSLIKAIATKKHPLVLFVDDLQWSDQATLNLIDALMNDSDSAYFLLFGAYRDNEVDASHPFIKTVTQMQKDGIAISTINIGNLKKNDISKLLAETLRENEKKIIKLVDLIHIKTQGNAFFVNKFIQNLYEEKLINYNIDSKQWEWDIDLINEQKLTDNVVELMSQKIKKFDKDTQNILTLSACIGNRFDLRTLGVISEKSQKENAKSLEDALKYGLIIPMKQEYKYTSFAENEKNIFYKFAHDRIQQAAYALLSENEKPLIHLNIGKLLQENTSKDEIENNIFDIVNHKNIGESLIVDESNRKEMAHMNLLAANKAKKSVAYTAANEFLDFSFKYLHKNHWDNEYNISYDISLLKAEISYMVQDFSGSKRLVNNIMKYAKTGIEKAKAENVSIVRETMQGNYQEALDHGRKGMAQAGYPLPESEYEENFGANLQEINTYLQKHTIESLSNLKESEDESVIIATEILMNLVPPSYIVFKPIFPIVCSASVLLSIKNGNTRYSSMGYSNYGIVLSAALGQHEAGYTFGKVALDVGKIFKDMQQICKNSFIFATFLNNWVRPIQESEDVNDEGYHVGMQSGELQFVGYILHSKLLNSFIRGESLGGIEKHAPQYYHFQQKTQNQWAIDSIAALSLVVSKIKGEDSFLVNKNEFLDSVSKNESQHGLCFYKIHMAQAEFIFNNYSESLKLTDEAEDLLPNIYGYLATAECNYYSSLSLSMVSLEEKGNQRNENIDKILKNQELLKIWSDNIPDNFLHKYKFIQAQISWLNNNLQEARTLYNEAITLALKFKFFQDVSIISECYGKFLLKNDTLRIAKIYFEDALYYYKRWEAKAKVLILQQFIDDTFENTEYISSHGKNKSKYQLDYDSVIKSVHHLSSDVQLSTLASNYVSISMENAGANKAVLLMPNKNTLQVVLKKETGKETQYNKNLSEFNENELLIHSVIHNVQNSHEAVIIPNASNNELYTNCLYVKKEKPLSVLAIPIMLKKSLKAILYLENSLVHDLFTQERVEILSILGAQAAVSFENAQLYLGLEEKIDERTKELQESNIQLKSTLSNLKTTQKQLIESEKIASLGSLVAGVAHEINTPIGLSITGITHLEYEIKKIIKIHKENKMTKTSFEDFLDSSESVSKLITKNLQHAAKLISSFKQVAVGQSNEQINKFLIREAIEQVVTSFSSPLKIKHINVDIDCSQDLYIKSYTGLIYQIFTNLINNSVIHAFDNNSSGNNINITVKEDGDSITVTFIDNGKGIEKDNISKIFDPFFTTKMGEGGTGLGLNIIYNIVTQQLKGQISVSSLINTGSTFTVILPKSI